MVDRDRRTENQMTSDILGRVKAAVGGRAEVVVRAPGRANLIGEHTDYNDGFVLPVALDLATYVAGTRTDSHLELGSLNEEGVATIDIRTGEGPISGWGRYATAVVRALLDEGVPLLGLRGVVGSDVPAGAGLSSSAALEIAIAMAVAAEVPAPAELARICRRAENVYVGVQCGIMDQLCSAAGIPGSALLIDCRNHDFQAVPLPEDLTLLVIDSSVERGLGDSAYNQRRSECERAAELLGVAALRDVSMPELERRTGSMDETLWRRARHVVGENERVVSTVRALRDGRLEEVGPLFEASHQSYSRDFEASLPEIDTLVDIARTTDGVMAARLTGGGFGGCTVNLVDVSSAVRAAEAILESYGETTGFAGRAWISPPSEGAGRLPSLGRRPNN
jgi:galactokinase